MFQWDSQSNLHWDLLWYFIEIVKAIYFEISYEIHIEIYFDVFFDKPAFSLCSISKNFLLENFLYQLCELKTSQVEVWGGYFHF